jgi:hypothetical protein
MRKMRATPTATMTRVTRISLSFGMMFFCVSVRESDAAPAGSFPRLRSPALFPSHIHFLTNTAIGLHADTSSKNGGEEGGV